MPVDLRQISFYPAQRQYIANDSQPSLELIQSGSGDYIVARASGGGTLFYDKKLMDNSMILAAFKAYDALKSDCTGLDMIKDPRTGNPVILEISYGFSSEAQIKANGYFDRNCVWHDIPFDPPRALLDNLVKEITFK